MKWTVVLTSFNRPSLVAQALQSVLTQTEEDFELLVADDDSNARTLEVIRAAAAGDARVGIIERAAGAVGSLSDRCSGPARYCLTINRALTVAGGDYVKYLCDDDALYPRALEALGRVFDEHPEVHVVYGKQRSITYDAKSVWDSGGRPRLIGSWPGEGDKDPETGRTVDLAAWSPGMRSPLVGIDHNAFAHRRVCLEELGNPPWWPEVPFDRDVGDAAFLRRLDALGHKALAVPEIVAVKRYHTANEDRGRRLEIRE